MSKHKPKKIDWNKRKKELERNIKHPKPNATTGQVLSPATVVVSVDAEFSFFKRYGYLTCIKTKLVHSGDHTATIQLTQEETTTLSQSWSQQLSSEIKTKLSSQIKGSFGVKDVAGIESAIASEIATGASFANGTSGAIEIQIKNSLQVGQQLELKSHARRCSQIRVPYGLELVLTVEGTITVTREFNLDLKTGKVTWLDTYRITFSLAIDTSVDPALDGAHIKRRRVSCGGREKKYASGIKTPPLKEIMRKRGQHRVFRE